MRDASSQPGAARLIPGLHPKLRGRQYALIEFLLSRYAEDEAVIERHVMLAEAMTLPFNRMADDIAAKRRIVDKYQDVEVAIRTQWNVELNARAAILAEVARDLATAYADHPDYLERWKP